MKFISLTFRVIFYSTNKQRFENCDNFNLGRVFSSYFQVLHIGGQIDILHCWLINFAPQKRGKKHESITTNKIIQKHQKIIDFSKSVENLYTYIALLQFASNTIMICSLAFLIVSVSKRRL